MTGHLYVYSRTLVEARDVARSLEVGDRQVVLLSRLGGPRRGVQFKLGDRIVFAHPPTERFLEIWLPTLSSVPNLTTEQAADMLNVPARVIANWKHRKSVTPIDWLPGGRGVRGGVGTPLYRATDLIGLVIQYHRRKL